MRVRIDEPRDDGGAPEIDDAGAAIAPSPHLRAAADGQDAITADGQPGRARPTGIERDDAGVPEDPVGGYFIQPFSR